MTQSPRKLSQLWEGRGDDPHNHAANRDPAHGSADATRDRLADACQRDLVEMVHFCLPVRSVVDENHKNRGTDGLHNRLARAARGDQGRLLAMARVALQKG